MTSAEIRQAFLDFFEKKGHKIVPSSSLLSSDPTVLLTTAGMQQFKEYYLEKPSPYGDRVASCQKCFRTSDIEEVGDKSHLTFLEMLGNFSFGDYFKKETIGFAYEILTDVYKLPTEDIWITYFGGDLSTGASTEQIRPELTVEGLIRMSSGQVVPEDVESQEIWQKLGIPRERMFAFDRKDNFWGPTGEEGPCGPTTEIHFDLTKKSCSKDCGPNCDCGRFIEVWNLVFNEYYQNRDKKLTLLEKKGVDTGMGFERLVMVIQGKSSIFETDLFNPLIEKITEDSAKPYSQNQKAYRIITDHIKGSVFLVAEGVVPSNVEEGYILRRVLRRAVRFSKLLDLGNNFLIPEAKKVIEIYKGIYPEIASKETDILTVIQNEEEKFEKTLERGIKETNSIIAGGSVSGEDAFYLYESYGFPLELTEELAKENGLTVDKKGFEHAFKKHQEISRAGAEKKFGGVGKEATYEAIKLHTATHLLHAALREVLGTHVRQMGSDITSQRLRFDFSHDAKMTQEEIKKAEDLVNKKNKEGLKVAREEMPHSKAIESGALAFFKEKYPEKVSVYSAEDPSGKIFSREICAGPHVSNTSELGHFKIMKEGSAGAGIRRIRAILEKR